MAKVGTADAIVRVIMKKTFLLTFAVIATASFLQASENQTSSLPVYSVSAERLQFIDQRLEAVVEEQTEQALSEPIPASAVAAANAMTRNQLQFALAKDARDIVLVATSNS